MPLGLMSGRLFSPFKRAISSRSSTFFCSSSAILVSNVATSSRSWAGVSSSRSGGGVTQSFNRKLRALRDPENQVSARSSLQCDISNSLGPAARCRGVRTGIPPTATLSANMTTAGGSCIRARGFAPITWQAGSSVYRKYRSLLVPSIIKGCPHSANAPTQPCESCPQVFQDLPLELALAAHRCSLQILRLLTFAYAGRHWHARH